MLVHLAQAEIGPGHRARKVLTTRDYQPQPFDQNARAARIAALSGPAALEVLVGLPAMNRGAGAKRP